MLVYAALTVLCIVGAAAVLWFFRVAKSAGSSTYRTLSPAARKKGNARYAHLNTTLSQTPSPWGWGQRRSRAAQIRSFGQGDGHHHAQPVVGRHVGDPRGRMTATQSARNVLTGYDLSKKNPVTDTSSWPYRDDDAGSSAPAPRPQGRSNGKKPWGW